MSAVTAKELYKSSHNRELHKAIEEIARTIDDKIIDANKNGEVKVEYDLPEYFPIGNLKKDDIQLVIYSELITKYERRGFNVSITPQSKLIIRWISVLDPIEKQRMKKVLSDHLTK